MLLKIGSKTDVGRQRENNEDALHHFSCDECDILIVCDGMGGHQGGEIASQLAVEHIEASFRRNTALPVSKRILAALNDASAAIFDLAESSPKLKGMGTTCVMLVADKLANQVWIAHVGDSRCYRLTAAGEFSRMTKDHSRVQEMVDAGWISPEEAAKSEIKNVITRALGVERAAQADVSAPITVANGDRFLLCTDGLTDMVTDADIADAVGRIIPPQAVVEELVNLANLRGGRDNITVCLAVFGKRKPVYPKQFIQQHGGLGDTQVERTLLGHIWHYGQYLVFALLLLTLVIAGINVWKPSLLPSCVRSGIATLASLFSHAETPLSPLVPSTNLVEHTNAITNHRPSVLPACTNEP